MHNSGGHCVTNGDSYVTYDDSKIVTITKNLVLINTINTGTASATDADYKIGTVFEHTYSTPSTSSTQVVLYDFFYEMMQKINICMCQCQTITTATDIREIYMPKNKGVLTLLEIAE